MFYYLLIVYEKSPSHFVAWGVRFHNDTPATYHVKLLLI